MFTWDWAFIFGLVAGTAAVYAGQGLARWSRAASARRSVARRRSTWQG